MNFVFEELYNVIEAGLITWFFISYFGLKQEYNSKIAIVAFFLSHFTIVNVVTIFELSWIPNFIVNVAEFLVLSELFCKRNISEHLIMAIIATILLALTSAYVITFIGNLTGVEYAVIAEQSSIVRFITVIIAKVFYFLAITVIISLKKKYVLMLHKVEYILITGTLLISFTLLFLIRNIIYDVKKYYGIFLVVLLCLLLLNIGQFFTIIYISKKNITEKNVALIKKQLELQEDNLLDLEEKYDETAKIRHDIKNHISCALTMAEQTEHETLIEYLRDLSEEKIVLVDNYVKTNRKVLNAVINTKYKTAKTKGIDIQCIVMDELNNINNLDISVLLSNLLDNAIEACEKNKMTSEIKLKIWSDAGYYCIELSNTVESDVLVDNPYLLTSKKDKQLHGIGLRSVRAIVDKYNGMINFYQKSNKFYAYVSLDRYII